MRPQTRRQRAAAAAAATAARSEAVAPTASHRLRFAGGAEADALLRCREHATAPLAQPFRLLREPPAWALDEAAARAAEDREHWRTRCGG